MLFFIVLLSIFADQQDQLRQEVENLHQALKEQKEKAESLQAINAKLLLDQNLMRLDQALETRPDRSLPSSTIRWVINLSEGLTPYDMLSGDTLDSVLHSPERGQLLQYLLGLNLADSTWRHICTHADFSYANLKGVDLSSANLSGINLEGAILYQTNCSKADLSHANLSKAKAQNSKFSQANLSGSTLQYTDLSWSDLSNCILDSAQMFGVRLANADLRQSSLCGADMQWSICHHTLFDQAILMETNLYGAELSHARFEQVRSFNLNLAESDISHAVFSDANLTKVNLHNASMQTKNWLTQIRKSGVLQTDSLKLAYKIVGDVTGRSVYRLKKMN